MSSEIWTRNDQVFIIDHFEKTLMTQSCAETKEKCLAFLQYKNPSKAYPTKEELHGGKNPGAVICSKYLNNVILILKDANNNENAFCQFKDGSLLQATSLI